jgi:hypothetical protein
LPNPVGLAVLRVEYDVHACEIDFSRGAGGNGKPSKWLEFEFPSISGRL